VQVALTVNGGTILPERAAAVLKPKPLREKFALRALPPESSEVITVTLATEDLTVEGWSFALCHTAGSAEVLEAAASPELQQLRGGEPPAFLLQEVAPADPFVAVRQTVILGSRNAPAAMGPFAEGLPVLGVRYRVLAEDQLKFCDFIGGVRFRNEVIHDGVSYEPRVRAGSRLVLGALGTAFIRGDANVDRVVDLTDAVSTFSALFLGGRRLPCLDAADVNDVGRVDITDPIFLLNHLFLGGPRPRPPFPEPGTDLSPQTALGCERGY
jgi:hypothetical protein